MSSCEILLPLLCLGESHCLRFRDRVWRSAHLPQPLLARSRFLRGLSAQEFSGPEGLHPQVAEVLIAEGLCAVQEDTEGAPFLESCHAPEGRQRRQEAVRHSHLADFALQPPALLLFAGDSDLIGLSADIGPETDFEFPRDPGYGLEAEARRLPFAAVELGLRSRLQPFLDGLQLLHEAGFTRTMVHGFAPRSRNPELVAQWQFGRDLLPGMRSKLALLGNEILAEACGELGFGFIDLWEELARDGYLDPSYELDGLHLGAGATALSLEAAAHWLRSAANWHGLPHELMAERGASPVESGPCVVDGDPALAAALVSRLDLGEPSAETWTHPDWVGPREPPAAVPGLRRLRVDMLQPLWELLVDPAEGTESAPCAGVRFAGVRAYAAATPDLVGRTWGFPCPPGGRRACTVLRGDLQLEFEEGESGSITLGPGQSLHFDARTPPPRCIATAADCVLVDWAMLPGPESEGLQLLDAGHNVWPVDPFRIAIPTPICDPPCPSGVLRRWTEVAGLTVPVDEATEVEASEPRACGSA